MLTPFVAVRRQIWVNMNSALEDYNEVVRLKPDFAEAYLNRGVVRVELGEHKEAITDYDKAIQFKPDLAEAYSIGRGQCEVGLWSQYKSALRRL